MRRFLLIAAAMAAIGSLDVVGAEQGHKAGTGNPADRAKPWLGVHVIAWGLAGGAEGLVPLKEAVEKVLAPAGVNVLVLEIGYNYEYKSHPELIQTKFLTKADVRDFVGFCRARGIRVIPQFNCLGHQGWRNTLYSLLTQYREFEEPPEDTPSGKRYFYKRSWCPLHPQINKIVFALMDELIDAFEADAFHVGMDEVMVIASSRCERCKDKSPAEVFAKAVNDYHEHLVDKKKLTMLMWGDRMVNGELLYGPSYAAYGRCAGNTKHGIAPAVDLIPKDIIICDWHYAKLPDYPSVRYFQEKGFRVWPASHANAAGTKALIACARRNADDRMLGHLCTSWVLEPGGYARALLGQSDPLLVSRRAIRSAEAFHAAMEEYPKDVTSAAASRP